LVVGSQVDLLADDRMFDAHRVAPPIRAVATWLAGGRCAIAFCTRKSTSGMLVHLVPSQVSAGWGVLWEADA
jgi:hypothetical protein